MSSPFRVVDPLRARLAETDARVRIADGDVKKAIETWVLVRAAFGCPAPAGLVEAMAQSGMLSRDVAQYTAGEQPAETTEQ